MNKRSFMISLTAAMVILAASVPTVLGGAATLVVDDDGMAVAGNCNSATPTYATIPAAITAALPGDIITVCPGTYTDQVIVNKDDLKLRGAHTGVSAFACPARTNVTRITGVSAAGTGAIWNSRRTG